MPSTTITSDIVVTIPMLHSYHLTASHADPTSWECPGLDCLDAEEQPQALAGIAKRKAIFEDAICPVDEWGSGVGSVAYSVANKAIASLFAELEAKQTTLQQLVDGVRFLSGTLQLEDAAEIEGLWDVDEADYKNYVVTKEGIKRIA